MVPSGPLGNYKIGIVPHVLELLSVITSIVYIISSIFVYVGNIPETLLRLLNRNAT